MAKENKKDYLKKKDIQLLQKGKNIKYYIKDFEKNFDKIIN